MIAPFRPTGMFCVVLFCACSGLHSFVAVAKTQTGKPAAQDPKQQDLFQPILNRATLVVGDQVLTPVDSTQDWRWEHHVGGFRLSVHEDDVIVRPSDQLDASKSIKSTDGHHLVFLGGNGDLAYFAGVHVDDHGRYDGYVEPINVLRLNLGTSQLGEGINPVPDEVAEYLPQDDLSLFTDDEFVVTVLSLVDGPSASDPPKTFYALSCFSAVNGELLWSKVIPGTKPHSANIGMLWAARMPQHAVSTVQRLSRMGDRLLVCCEAKQPILCLNIDTGTELWRCENVWEFQRGFIGPSVWAHYIDRFGIQTTFGHDDDELATATQRFNEQFECAVIGGPIAAPIEFERDNDTHSIFVAVSREPNKAFGGYLADCLIYELSDDGEVISMANLPQLVNGGRYHRSDEGLIWKCHNNAILKLRSSPHAPRMGFGPGGPDLITRLAWFRQFEPVRHQGWLVSDAATDSLAFGTGIGFRISSGGFIADENDSVYQFPIAVIDLDTGHSREIFLKVPFSGDVPEPESNFGKTTLPDGRTGFYTLGPHVLAITFLESVGTRLIVTLGMADQALAVEFDLSQTEIWTAKASQRSDDSSIQEFDAGDPNSSDENGNTLLHAAAQDASPARVKALIAAGADVNARSKYGWSPLMVAACYGTAESVKSLVEAGADVNVQDNNCGGQSILMWAARSRRESKQKVETLLGAGVDHDLVSESGWNALMSAAAHGNIESVELLIAAGFDVTYRANNGRTVLMAAAGSRSAALIPVLISAGAEVNAQDDSGKTALMYAADGYGQGEVVQALLEAGADPFVKDEKGLTALDYTKDLNHVGAEERARILQKAMKK